MSSYKYTQDVRLRHGLCPDSCWRAYSAPSDPLAGREGVASFSLKFRPRFRPSDSIYGSLGFRGPNLYPFYRKLCCLYVFVEVFKM